MKEITTYGKIEAGKLHISRRDQFVEALACWASCRVVVTVKKIYSKRSLPQNGYVHGVLFPEIRAGLIDNGYRADECTLEAVKDLMKSMFAKREMVNEKTGEVLTTIQPTSQMTTTEMMEFIQACRQFSEEYLSRYIPGPNEQTKIFNI